MPSTKELVEELNKQRAEVSKLKSALNELDREKESWFQKKNELSLQIRDSIRKIKENKSARDTLTKEVKELKPKRDTLNKEISPKSSELEKLKQEISESSKSLRIAESPSRIRQQIEKLEFKIETDTVSFEKEKELMKKINALRRSYEKARALEQSNKKIKDILDSISKLRKGAHEAHRAVQEKASQSQSFHEGMLKTSAEIGKMKAEEQEAFKKFLELKKKFNEMNAQLKEKLRLMGGIKSQLDKVYSEKKEKRKQEEESFLKSKEEEVNEKIRKGKKLTTEDFLVFQQKFGKK